MQSNLRMGMEEHLLGSLGWQICKCYISLSKNSSIGFYSSFDYSQLTISKYNWFSLFQGLPYYKNIEFLIKKYKFYWTYNKLSMRFIYFFQMGDMFKWRWIVSSSITCSIKILHQPHMKMLIHVRAILQWGF